MTKVHFEAFAEQARICRQNARVHERGDKALEDACYQQALGIEQAVINVAKRFNPRFDEVRFRQACQIKPA